MSKIKTDMDALRIYHSAMLAVKEIAKDSNSSTHDKAAFLDSIETYSRELKSNLQTDDAT